METIGDLTFQRNMLLSKYEEIVRRMTGACSQLDDEALYWRPTPESNSIANLVLHIAGNIRERIGVGMRGEPYERIREKEFGATNGHTREQLMALLEQSFDLLGRALREATPEQLSQSQIIRGKERSNLLIFHQCANHFSEHLGQVLYIAKMKLGDRYVSTSG